MDHGFPLLDILCSSATSKFTFTFAASHVQYAYDSLKLIIRYYYL